MKRRWWLFGALSGMLACGVLSGCASSQFVHKSQSELDAMEVDSHRASGLFLSGNYAASEKILQELTRERTVSQPLYLCELGTVQLAQNQNEKALQTLLKAQQDLEVLFDKDKEEQAQSLWSGEINKVYKGDPHEAASLYMLIGTLFINQKDYENAIAALKSALLRDGDSNGKDGGVTSDNALVQLLLARCYQMTGDRENEIRYKNMALFCIYDIHPDAPLVFQGAYDALFRYIALKRLVPRLDTMAQSDLVSDSDRKVLEESSSNLKSLTLRAFLTQLKEELTLLDRRMRDEELTTYLQPKKPVPGNAEIDRISRASHTGLRSNAALRYQFVREAAIRAGNERRIAEIDRLLALDDDKLNQMVAESDKLDWFGLLDPVSPYASLNLPHNTLMLAWQGQGPFFRRTGDFDEIRTLCFGQKNSEFLGMVVDGVRCRAVKGAGDVNYQAATRGERLMDEILRSKAQTKLITRIVAVGMFSTGVALVTMGDQVSMIVGGGLMAFGGITYGITYLMQTRADHRCWKNLPGEFYLYPTTLAGGEHKVKLEAFDGPCRTASREVTVTRSMVPDFQVLHVFAGNIGGQGEVFRTQWYAERYLLFDFLATESEWKRTMTPATRNALAEEWDRISTEHRGRILGGGLTAELSNFSTIRR